MTELEVLSPPVPPVSPRRPLLIAVAVLIALLGVLAGAAGGVGYLLYAGFEKPVERSYDISVFLKPEATEAQKKAIHDQLAKVPHEGEVRFENRDQALARFKELWKDEPSFAEQVNAKSLPESYRLTSKVAAFDCAPMKVAGQMAGVNDVVIVMYPVKNEPGGSIRC
ncbi:permease-like cell division protein FtsX [Actinoplanes sp. CA-054009]